MAVKIARQPNKVAVLGAPTSAGASSPGPEGAPAALRAAGLTGRLQAIGYEVADLGDDPPSPFKQDEESPRARNISGVIAALEALKPRVEQAVKSGALPLILSGDCSVALATIAGVRRYFRHVGLVYVDRDADLNTPATTPSGFVDGMVVSHLTGRGAAELVRFWGEPPLVREPDLALFGVDRLDPAEAEMLVQSPLRRYHAADVLRLGASPSAETAIDRIHGRTSEFVLHFDVDVISDFQATNYPGTGGLGVNEVREALGMFVRQKRLAAIEVTGYNPAKDPDGSGAKLVLDLLVDALEGRLKALQAGEPGDEAPVKESREPETPLPDAAASPGPISEPAAPPTAPLESLEEKLEHPNAPAEAPGNEPPSAPDAGEESGS